MTLHIDGKPVSAPAVIGDFSTPATIAPGAVVWIDVRRNGSHLAYRVASVDAEADTATLVPASARDIARAA